MEEFIALQKHVASSAVERSHLETEKSWVLNVNDLEETTFDLSPKNPNIPEEAPLRNPEKIFEDMVSLDEQTNSILNKIKELI